MRTKFDASQFTATECSTQADKAKFAAQFIRWVESDFAWSQFRKWFYTQLSMCFGHIAHYNQRGFYDVFTHTTRDKIEFLRQTVNGGQYGDPAYCYCDVEKVLAAWVHKSGLISKYQALEDANVEKAERAVLTRLKEKYEPARKPGEHVMSAAPVPRCIYCGADEDDVFVAGEPCEGGTK